MDRDYAGIRDFIAWAKDQGAWEVIVGDVKVSLIRTDLAMGVPLQGAAQPGHAVRSTPLGTLSVVDGKTPTPADLNDLLAIRTAQERATGLPEFQDPAELLDRWEGKGVDPSTPGAEPSGGKQ